MNTQFDKAIKQAKKNGESGIITLCDYNNGKPGCDRLIYNLTTDKPVLFQPYISGLLL
jgi:hypothetical protein